MSDQFAHRNGGHHDDESDFEVAASMHFLCGTCKHPAQMTGDEIDGETTLERVACLTCGTALDGDDLETMYLTLVMRYRDQMGSQISGLFLREHGFPNAPVGRIDDEFSDPRWPFVLKVEPHDEPIN